MNAKYYYGGIPLKEYCEENSIKYRKIIERILALRKKDPTLSDEELIAFALNEANYTNNRGEYYYQGMSLKQYCIKKSINYRMITQRIRNLRKKESTLSDEELITLALNEDNYTNSRTKYYYEGIPLKEYCKENSINYLKIVNRISDLRKKESTLSDEELIAFALNEDNYTNNRGEYYYQGMSLKQYCIKNSINYRTIMARIQKLNILNPNLSKEELVHYALKSGDESIHCFLSRNRYYFQEMHLRKYCEENSIKYSKIIDRINALRKKDPNLSDEELVILALNEDNYTDYRYKYYYKGNTLDSYCSEHGYVYKTVVKKYIKKKQELSEIDDEKIMDLVIEEYRLKKEKRDKIKKIREVFHDLENNQDMKKVKEYCSFLAINFENVQELKNVGYTTYQAVSLIWYFSDQQDEKNNKILSPDHLIEIENLTHSDLSTLNICMLIFFYKCHLVDTREILWNRCLGIGKRMISEVIQEARIIIPIEQYPDVLNELQVCVLELIDSTFSNTGGQVMNYLKKSMKGRILNYKKTNFSYESLDEDIGENKKEKKLDLVASKPLRRDEAFSEEMLEIIKAFPKEEIQFLLLRFQENFSYEELAERFGVLISDIQEKERAILNKIKESLYQNENSLILKKVKVR